MRVFNFKDFMKKYISKKDTLTESEVQRVYIFPIYPGDSEKYSKKGFVIFDKGSMNGTHWTCFYIKDDKSYYLDSFGGAPDKFLLKQLPKPIIYHKYKIQDINSRLSDSYCLYFSCLIERMNYYDTFLKLYFKDQFRELK